MKKYRHLKKALKKGDYRPGIFLNYMKARLRRLTKERRNKVLDFDLRTIMGYNCNIDYSSKDDSTLVVDVILPGLVRNIEVPIILGGLDDQ